MDIDKIEILDPEWASELQIDLQEYLMCLYDSVDAEEGTIEYERGIDTASGQPFCGCDVCQGREILSFLSGKIIKGYESKKIALYGASSSSPSASPGAEESSSVISCRSSDASSG
jgi:hypothetical protein